VKISYRTLRTGEEAAASAVVNAAFSELVAPGYSEEGVAEFRSYAHANSIKARRESTSKPHYALVATAAQEGGAEEIVGVGEVRSFEHLSMLFVHPDWHRHGIAGELFARLLAEVRSQNPELERLTVNSSPFAVPIYERFGFEVTGEPITISGIIHIPMALDLAEDDQG
jgi:GNAT superfamily N-acetyltransferase